MLQALRFAPPTVQHVHLYVNLYHVHPIALGDFDSALLQSNLSGCRNLQTLRITLTTERDRCVVPMEAGACSEVFKAVRNGMVSSLGSIFSLI